MRCKYRLDMDVKAFLEEFNMNYCSLFEMENNGADMDAYIEERKGMMLEFDELFDNKRFIEFLRGFVALRGDLIDTSFEQIAYMTTLKDMQKKRKAA